MNFNSLSDASHRLKSSLGKLSKSGIRGLGGNLAQVALKSTEYKRDRNNNKICSAHIHPAGCSRRESRNTGASPFSFTISVLGSFTCITQHTGPTALRPIRRTKQLRLSVLLKDTSAAAGIRTHILATPELESNAQY